MGVVYGARHVRLTRRKSAIKVLDERLAQDPNARKRFEQEAFFAAGIQHEHVIQVENVSETESGIPFHVMEFLDGEDLDHLLARNGPLPWRRVRAIAGQICDGLAAIHRAGLVHRDLKPGNCFRINRRSNEDYIKILDFGLVKQDPKSGAHQETNLARPQTAQGISLGTQGFMSPEQRAGNSQAVDARSDIYSCGALIFNLLTNRLPIEGVSLGETLEDKLCFDNSVRLSRTENFRLLSELERFFRCAMHMDSGERFQTTQELQRALLGIDVGYTHDVRMPRPGPSFQDFNSVNIASHPEQSHQEVPQTRICIVEGDALAHKADALILKHAQMILGLDEAVYRRLLPLGVDESYFCPIDGESYLFDSRGGISARSVIVVGSPSPINFDYRNVREIATTALSRLRQAPQEMEFQEVAMTLHGVGIGLDENEAFKSLIEGIRHAIQNEKSPTKLRKLCIIERDPRRANRLRQSLEKILPNGYIQRRETPARRTARISLSDQGLRNKPYVLVLMADGNDMEDAYLYGISRPAQSLGLLCERHDLNMNIPHSSEWLRARIMGARALIVHPSLGDQKQIFSIGFAQGCGITTILLYDRRHPPQLAFDLDRCIEYGTISELERRLTPELQKLAGY